jgi:hypothetical protein
MHSLFTENATRTFFEKLKSACQIKAIPISQAQIIHNFFPVKTAAVNKFLLLSFGKIRSTEKFEGAEFSYVTRHFQKKKTMG